jgi:DnaJ-class molecular chaperone
VVIPPGCPEGTVYRFSNVGHELTEDVFQDIHLIFMEKVHPLLFKHIGPDISALLCLSWTQSLEEGPHQFSVTRIDGKKYTVEIDYRFSKMVDGSVTFYEAGMPMPDGRGRGKFIVK